MRVADKIELDAQVERELRVRSKRRRVQARVQQRASVILLAAKGWQNKEIAVEVKLDRRQVALWRRRFSEGGVQALMQDAARSGRTPSGTPEARIAHRQDDVERQAACGHALEHAHAGRGVGLERHDDPARLAAQRAQAASAAHLQALARPALRGQAVRRCGPVPRATRQGNRAQLRLEEPRSRW